MWHGSQACCWCSAWRRSSAASGRITSRSLRATLLLGPVILLLSAGGLLIGGSLPLIAAILTAVWGFGNGMVPVGWSHWITRTLPDAAEPAGGLQVAVIQFANIAGSAVGGVVLDHIGPRAPLMTASVLFIAAAAIVAFRLQVRPAAQTSGASVEPDHIAARQAA